MDENNTKAANSTQTTAKTNMSREELQKTVKNQIMMSIGLEYEAKGKLIQKLPSLSDEQIQQLHEVFNEEVQRKEQILNDLFTKKPELYQEFEKFSRDHVNSIYREVEDGELTQENQKMEELLNANY